MSINIRISKGINISLKGSAKTLLTAGTNLYIEKSTGKTTFQHVADNTIDAELRDCQINHSAEINKIFFETLDQFDCVIKQFMIILKNDMKLIQKISFS